MDEVGAIFFIAACIAFVVTLGLVALLIWMLISGIVVLVRYQVAYAEAGRVYERVEGEVGVGYKADDVLRSVFGVKLEPDGYDSTVDWLQNSVFGVKVGDE